MRLPRLLLSVTFASVSFAPAFAKSESATDVSSLVRIDGEEIDRSLNGGVVSYAASLVEARPAVVSVYSKSQAREAGGEELLLEQLFGLTPKNQRSPFFGLGSGVIVSKNGYILTNYHVVSQADEIRVQLDDRKIYDATLIGTDPSTDIAVIKIDAEDLPTVTLANSDLIEVGDVVFAIGNPLGVGKTVTMGIVSATKRQEMGIIEGGFEDFIQTDAPINTGNSGGALIDAKGRLIGINTLIQTDGASSGSIGIGFAVPVNLAYSVMTDLIETGAVSRGFLGVGIESLDEERAERLGIVSLRGALVNQVNPGTPAEKAGLQTGDLIVSVDGSEITSPSDLRVTIAQRKPGDEVLLVVVRDGERREFATVLADRGAVQTASQPLPSPPVPVPVEGFLEGVTIESLNVELREKFGFDESVEGVVVTEVEAGSPFEPLLPVGMAILKVNGRKVSDPDAAAVMINRAGKNMLLVTYRGVYRWVAIEVE